MSVEHKSISEDPKKQDKKLFRKAVARFGLVGLALFPTAACDFTSPTTSFEPVPISTSFSPNPTEITREPEYDYSKHLGVQVAFDKSLGLPVKYILEDGKEVRFDMERMKKLREEALISGEPQIATMILLDNATQRNKSDYGKESDYSAEHPKVSDLPRDVLSEEELANKGVSVIQAGDITTLFIRESAFEEGNPLAAFNSTGRKLTILLLEGSVIDQKYLMDPKYADVINEIPIENRSAKDRREYMVKNEKFLSQKTISLVRQGMVKSCAAGGVAWPLFDLRIKNSKLKIDNKNFFEVPQATVSATFKDVRRVSVACKTGTAQHGGEKDLPHAWITLFAPSHDPEIVVTVLAESSGEGSNIAAPIAKKILEDWFSR